MPDPCLCFHVPGLSCSVFLSSMVSLGGMPIPVFCCESQTNRMCMQVSVSMSVLSVFVLSAFVCLFTALKVQIIR